MCITAVAFDSTLTLWDPDTNDLCQTLSHPDAITHVVPCLNCSMHLLITGTRSSIFVWNLLTCSSESTVPQTSLQIYLHPLMAFPVSPDCVSQSNGVPKSSPSLLWQTQLQMLWQFSLEKIHVRNHRAINIRNLQPFTTISTLFSANL